MKETILMCFVVVKPSPMIEPTGDSCTCLTPFLIRCTSTTMNYLPLQDQCFYVLV